MPEDLGLQGRAAVLEAMADVVQAALTLGAEIEGLDEVRQAAATVEKIEQLYPCTELLADMPEGKELTPKALYLKVQQLRTESSACFKAHQVQRAACFLQEALRIMQPYQHRWLAACKPGSNAERLRSAQLTMITNLALCYLQGQPGMAPEPGEALECCRQVLLVDPDNTKALLRRGRALALLGRPEEAATDFARVAELLEPSDPATRRELEEARRSVGQAGQPGRAGGAASGDAGAVPVPGSGYGASGDAGAAPVSGAREVDPQSWPEACLPTPQGQLGAHGIQECVAEVASTLHQAGEEAFVEALLGALRGAVERQYGEGHGKQVSRVVAMVQRMVRGETRQVYVPQKGQRLVSAHLHNLSPDQPVHDPSSHPWCAQLASVATSLLDELGPPGAGPSWERPAPWGFPHKDGASACAAQPLQRVMLLEGGAWIAGDGLPTARRDPTDTTRWPRDPLVVG